MTAVLKYIIPQNKGVCGVRHRQRSRKLPTKAAEVNQPKNSLFIILGLLFVTFALLFAQPVVTPMYELSIERLWPKLDSRTLKLAKYIKAVPPPPVQAGYIDKVSDWPLMLNDSIGDCTVAAAGHMIEQWTAYANPPTFIPSDKDILTAYMAVSGYTPNNPSTDNGAVMLDVLNYWRTHGIAGRKIIAFVSLNPKNRVEVEQAVSLFGNCYIGIGLPIAAQNPLDGVNGYPVWSMPPNGPRGDGAPWSWGGHSVPILGYGHDVASNRGTMVLTWGQLFDMTWGFMQLYCDEAYAVLSQDWIDAHGLSGSGFDLATLQKDLADITR